MSEANTPAVTAANLPSAATDRDAYMKAMQTEAPATRIEGGYLRCNGKTGEWTCGGDDESVTGAVMVVNPFTFMRGWQRWDTQPPQRVLAPYIDPMPPQFPPVDGTDRDGNPCTHTSKKTIQFMSKFVDDDEDLGQAIFNTDSMGGIENTEKFRAACIARYLEVQGTADADYVFPKVKLATEWYKRATGKVYKPVFEVIGWVNDHGIAKGAAAAKLDAPDETLDTAEEEEQAPRRRRRRA